MKKNFTYYVMLAAAATGRELPPVERKMIVQFLQGDNSIAG